VKTKLETNYWSSQTTASEKMTKYKKINKGSSKLHEL